MRHHYPTDAFGVAVVTISNAISCIDDIAMVGPVQICRSVDPTCLEILIVRLDDDAEKVSEL
jgi:hypothetical protein